MVWQHGGYAWGCEFKFSDAPVLTKSMHNAVQDLQLKKAWIVYPGQKKYKVKNTIEVIPFDDIPDVWVYD
jgi:hypothetical protein